MARFVFVKDGFKVYFVYANHGMGSHGPFIGRVRRAKTGWRHWQYQAPYQDSWTDVGVHQANSREQAAEELRRIYAEDQDKLRRMRGPAMTIERAAAQIEVAISQMEADLLAMGVPPLATTNDRLRQAVESMRKMGSWMEVHE